MARLVVLQHDPVARARLRDALEGRHELLEVDSWSALERALSLHDIDGCVIDPFATEPVVAPSDLARLRRRRPHLVVVVFADFAGRGPQAVRLSTILDEIIVAGTEDDPRTIRTLVLRALGRTLARRVESAVSNRLSGLETRALVWAIEHATEAPTVDQLAAGLGLRSGTLRRRLREEGEHTARRLLLWGRLFRGVQMLGKGGRSVTRAALALGYESDSGFRRALRRHVGLTSAQFSGTDGLAQALDRFATPDQPPGSP